MKRYILLLTSALFALTALQGQQFCKRTSLFFDLDKSDLTDVTKKRLDSIVRLIGPNEFLVEMYGHADSLASNAYNLQLAGSRMSEVENYLTSKTKGKLEFKKKNFGETNYKISNSQEANLAFNRRVDLYLVPMTNGKLIITGSRNESVEVPADYFEPCGVCNSAPSVKGYYSQEEGNDANIVMQSSDGIQLTTAGSINVDFNPCSGKKNDTSTFVIRVCADKLDTAMRIWEADTVQGRIYWKETNKKPTFDANQGCYVFRGNGMCNLDKKPVPQIVVTCTIILPTEFGFRNSLFSDNKRMKKQLSKEDTVKFENADTILSFHGFGATNGKYYYLNRPLDSIPEVTVKEGLHITKTYYTTPEMYTEFTYSDTALKIKNRKSMHAEQFGYYLKDYNVFIPITESDGKYFTDKKPDGPYQYGFIRKNKLYVIDNKKVKSKYNSKTNSVNIKFNRKTSKRFRPVKDFKIAPKGNNA
jgi:hypothetical protein